MSFTQKVYPQEFQPVFNPIVFIVDSSNKGNCDYRYVGDLYVNGVLATRLFVYPEGPNDYGVFRIERILQDYISYDLKPNVVGFDSNPNSIVEYYMDFSDEFGTASPCDGITTVSSVVSTSSVFYAFNGAWQDQEFIKYTSAENSLGNTSSKFLTKMPDNLPVVIDEYYTLSYLQPPATIGKYLIVTTYGQAGNLIGTYLTQSPFLSASPTGFAKVHYISIGVGPVQLNAVTLSSGAQPVITASVFYYHCTILDAGFNSMTETKIFKIDKSCFKFDVKRLWWWNRHGGFDAYSFKLKSLRNIDIGRAEYNKLKDTLHDKDFGYMSSDRGRTIMSVKAREIMTYNTGYMSEEEGLFLEELFTSPEVYACIMEAPVVYTITGMAYDDGFTIIAIDAGVKLPRGTYFTYSVDDASGIGVANVGSGHVTHFNGTDQVTDIVATINTGIGCNGTLTAYPGLTAFVVKSAQWEEKLKNNKKRINYSIEINPDRDLNIQRT